RPLSGRGPGFFFHSFHAGQDHPGHSLPGRGRRQRLAAAFRVLDPLVHVLAPLCIDDRLIITVATEADDPGTLADETSISLGPFNSLHVARAFLPGSDRASCAASCAARTSFMIRRRDTRFKWDLAYGRLPGRINRPTGENRSSDSSYPGSPDSHSAP